MKWLLILLMAGSLFGAGQFGANLGIEATGVDCRGQSKATVIGWFRPDSVYGSSGNQYIYYEASNNGETWIRLAIGYANADSEISGLIRLGDTDSNIFINKSGAIVNFAEWNHIALVFDSDTDDHALYFNGELVQDTTVASEPFQDEASARTGQIGLYSNYSDPSYFFYGQIDDVRVYFDALTATDIKQIYTLRNYNDHVKWGSCQYQSRLYGAGQIVPADLTGNGNDGTLVGTPIYKPTATRVLRRR